MEGFDVAAVREAAQAALVKNHNNPEESRQKFVEEILDWTDNYTENYMSEPDSAESKRVCECIGQLWIAYAQMEIGLKQFKKVGQIFDDAMNDAVAGACRDVYLAYANFSKDRNKIGNAQKAFIRGLSSKVLSKQDLAILWKEFFAMSQEIASAEGEQLTMHSLYLLTKQHMGKEAADIVDPSEVFDELKNKIATETKDILARDVSEAESKEQHQREVAFPVPASLVADATIEASKPASTTLVVEQITQSAGADAMHVSSDDESSSAHPPKTAVAIGTATEDSADNLDDVSMFTPEELRIVFGAHPPSLFHTPEHELMRQGVQQLSEEEVRIIEDRYRCRLPHRSATTALCSERFAHVLDVIEALWTMQALKERHFEAWFSMLRSHHIEEKKAITEQFLDEKGLNEELARFRTKCDVQREILIAIVNKTLYSLLATQQLVLLTLELPFPVFNTLVLQQISSILERQSMGFNVKEKKLDSEIVDTIMKQGRIVSALLSLRFGERRHRAFIPEVISYAAATGRLFHQTAAHSQGQTHAVSAATAGAKLMVDNALRQPQMLPAYPQIVTPSVAVTGLQSLDLPTPSSPEGAEDLSDYYSLEAKKRRKKRRLQSGLPSASPDSSPVADGASESVGAPVDDSFSLEDALRASASQSTDNPDILAKIDNFLGSLEDAAVAPSVATAATLPSRTVPAPATAPMLSQLQADTGTARQLRPASSSTVTTPRLSFKTRLEDLPVKRVLRTATAAPSQGPTVSPQKASAQSQQQQQQTDAQKFQLLNQLATLMHQAQK